MHSTSFCVLLNFECLYLVVSDSGVSAWLPPVLDLKSLCGRSTLGGGLRLGAHGSPTHHTALTTHLFKMPYILSHLVSDRQNDVSYFKEEIGNYNLRNSKASHLMDDALDAITHWTLQRKHERCLSPTLLPTMTKILIVLNCWCPRH